MSQQRKIPREMNLPAVFQTVNEVQGAVIPHQSGPCKLEGE